MEINTWNDFWKILKLKFPKKSKFTNSSLEPQICQAVRTLSHPILLIIDEFESFIDRWKKEWVIKLLLLPKLTGGKIMLISISNLVSMPDLLMPELEGRSCLPEVIVFPPYTKEEIISIIIKKLPGEKDESALDFCARQVEKFGDVREALDMCKNSIRNGKL